MIADTDDDRTQDAVRYVGLDLGQLQDYTALVVVEQTWRADGSEDFQVGYLWRPNKGTPYARIVESVRTLVNQPTMRDRCAALCVDATGVGRPVVELLRDADLPVNVVAITITGGDTAHRVTDTPGANRYAPEYRVPKRDLAGELATLLQATGDDTLSSPPAVRLRFAQGLRLETTMRAELANFKAKINTATGHDTYEAGPAGDWREGEHDDLVLALALPIWYARRAAALSGVIPAGAPFIGGMRRRGQ